MSLRVPSSLFSSQALHYIEQRNIELFRLQQQASSGLRISKPSDDPAGVRSLLAEKTNATRLERDKQNVEEARTRLNHSVSQLLTATDLLVQARQIAMTGNNQPIDQSEREALAHQVDRLLDRMVQLANTDDRGQYLFGGTATNRPPFELDRSGSLPAVRYVGNDQRASIMIGREAAVDVFYTGEEIFQQRSRTEPVWLTNTGAVPGSGTPNATGTHLLEVHYEETTYLGNSGIQPGAGADTVLGPVGTHTLQVTDTSGDGSSGLVSLNGAAAVAFTNQDADLKVTGPQGEVVYVNTTSIASGFSGNVDLSATGSFSFAGDDTSKPIDFSENQQLPVPGGRGEVVFINSSGVRRPGTISIEHPGTNDVFQTLVALRDELRNSRDLTSAELDQAMARRLDDLDRIRDDILDVVGEQSAMLQSLDAVQHRIEDLELESARVLSRLESADMAQVAIQLQQQQQLLQFTFASTARLLEQSLLSFLR